MDTSVSVSGKRGSAPVDAVEYLDGPPSTQAKRCRVDDLRLASDADTEVVRGHARRRFPGLKSTFDATQSSAAEGVGAATSA